MAEEQRSHPTANPHSYASAGTAPNEAAIDRATQRAAAYHDERRAGANPQRVQLRIIKRLASSIVGAQQIGDVVWATAHQARLLIDENVAQYVGAAENKMYQPTNVQETPEPLPQNRMNVGKQPEAAPAASARPTPSTEVKGGPSTATAKSNEAGKAKP